MEINARSIDALVERTDNRMAIFNEANHLTRVSLSIVDRIKNKLVHGVN